MRCSECSKLVMPVIAVDIDGTLGDYHSHLIRFARGYLGKVGRISVKGYGGTIPFRDWFCEYFDVDLTTFRQVKLAYRQGGMKRTMPLFKEMDRIMAALAPQAEIWLCTTRPYLRLDAVDPDTRFWLERHSIPYDGLLYDEQKYRVLRQNVDADRIVAVVDDLAEQLHHAASLFGPDVAVLRRNGYNGGVVVPYEVQDTPRGLYDSITRRIAKWKEEHEGHE